MDNHDEERQRRNRLRNRRNQAYRRQNAVIREQERQQDRQHQFDRRRQNREERHERFLRRMGNQGNPIAENPVVETSLQFGLLNIAADIQENPIENPVVETPLQFGLLNTQGSNSFDNIAAEGMDIQVQFPIAAEGMDIEENPTENLRSGVSTTGFSIGF